MYNIDKWEFHFWIKVMLQDFKSDMVTLKSFKTSMIVPLTPINYFVQDKNGLALTTS